MRARIGRRAPATRRRPLRLVSLILAVVAIAAAGSAQAQAPALFSADQFDKIDLVPNQAGGEGVGLLETLGAATDRFEPINGFSERNKYRVLGRSIGRLKVLATRPGGYRGVATCTAALIAADRLITNYHCVPGVQGETVEQVKVEFFYLDLGTNTVQAFAVDPAPVEADRTLDYAILTVAGDPSRVAGIAPLAFKPRAIQNNESLFLIHHPAGQPQRLTRAYCRAHGAKAVDGAEIRHLCDTLPGSSGALVFADDDFTIVGLHHRGGLTPGDASSFNRGTGVMALEKKSAVLAALALGLDPAGPTPASPSNKGSDLRGQTPAGPKDTATSLLGQPNTQPGSRAARLIACPHEKGHVLATVGAEERCLKPGDVFRDCEEKDADGNFVCPEMVVIPRGEFTMGSEDGDSDEKPPHKVTIAKPFAVGKFEVTFAEWDACVAAGGCKRKPGDEGWGRGTRPVINVSWDDITKEYLPWLSKKTGKIYRLPSEAEWEYAARAGTKTKYSFGDTITKKQAQFPEGGSGSANLTVDVGSFSPNAFGLHDMHGNVWEGVEDCYRESYQGAPSDGSPWTTGACEKASDGKNVRRVLRGGSWISIPGDLRSTNRFGFVADDWSRYFGFRLARTITP